MFKMIKRWLRLDTSSHINIPIIVFVVSRMETGRGEVVEAIFKTREAAHSYLVKIGNKPYRIMAIHVRG